MPCNNVSSASELWEMPRSFLMLPWPVEMVSLWKPTRWSWLAPVTHPLVKAGGFCLSSSSKFVPYWKSLRLDISTHLLHMPYDLVLFDRSWKKGQLLCLHTFTFTKICIPGLLLKSVDGHERFFLQGFGAARTTLWSRLIVMTIISGKLRLDRSPPPTCHFFLAKSEQGAPPPHPPSEAFWKHKWT